MICIVSERKAKTGKGGERKRGKKEEKATSRLLRTTSTRSPGITSTPPFCSLEPLPASMLLIEVRPGASGFVKVTLSITVTAA